MLTNNPSRRDLLNAIRVVVLACGSFMSTALDAAPQAAKPQPIRVYVFTAEVVGGFVDAESTQRRDSVKDLREALGKKKAVTVVDSREEAEVLVEVLGRGHEETGALSTTTNPTLGGARSSTTRDTEAMVRTKLSVGAYSTEIVGKNDGRLVNVWRTAANNAANQIDKWVTANQERLRGPRSVQR